MNMISIICISLVIALTYAKLTILGPQELLNNISKEPFSYSLANFGLIPYGRKMMGQIDLPPSNSNDTFNLDLCQPIDLTSQNTSIGMVPQTRKSNPQVSSWFIVQRGNCSFTRKTINAQDAGASMIIIVDNTDEPNFIQVVMADDGSGYLVSIPSILLSKNDGDQLLNWLKSGTKTPIKAMILFNETSQVEKPGVLFGLSLQNRETFKLVREFKQFYFQLKNDGNYQYLNQHKASFQIFYEIFPSWKSVFSTFDEEEIDCLGGGRYCNKDPDGFGVGTGRNIVQEALRQACLFQIDSDYWWDYMDQFDDNCIAPQAFEKCSSDLLKNKQKLKDLIQGCVDQSFNPLQTKKLLATNSMLDQWLEYKSTSGILFYPGATVNNVTYRGNIEAVDIAEDVCSGMINLSRACLDLYSKLYSDDLPDSSSETSYIGLLMIIVGICVVFVLFMVLIYRRMLRRELKNEMGNSVNQMVSQYISFYESKSQKQGSEQ